MALILAILVFIAMGFLGGLAVAQPATPPPAGAPTCEAQLEEARVINIRLRKAKAEADFTAATLEEATLAMQKRLDAEAKSKSAAASPVAAPQK